MKKRTIIIIPLILLIILGCFLLLHFGEKILSKNYPVKANILIIEGWLPVSNLEMMSQYLDISKYETVIVTGLAYTFHEDVLHNSMFEKSRDIEIANGGAYLKDNALSQIHGDDTVKSIKIFSHGTKALGKFPHYLIYLNDSIVGAAQTTEVNKIPAVFNINYPSHKLHKLLIYFDNDVETNNEDRNLWIDSIIINSKSYAGSKYFARVDDYEAKKFINITSDSRKTGIFLTYLGIKKPVIILDTMYLGRNRTRAFAVKCKKWIDKTYKNKPYSINIVSLNYHSKRTYYTYKSLEKGIDIGVISMPMSENIDIIKGSKIRGYKYIIKEYISLILNFVY